MGDGYWSVGCRSDVEWYGVPGTGCWYRSQYGTYSVTGGVYQKYAEMGYECGVLGPPVKAYGWVQEMNYGRGCYGQWMWNGAIGYHDGAWRVMLGRYGQSSLRRTLLHPIRTFARPRADAEVPPDAPVALPEPPKEKS